MRVRRDGKLYVAIGDGGNGGNSQNAGNLLGKLLRLNKDGSIPTDNPNYGTYTGNLRAIVALYSADAPPDATTHTLTFYETSEAAGWMVQTLLPPEKRKLVAAEIAAAYQDHSAEILAALKPVVQDTLRDVASMVEAELPTVIARHKSEIEDLGGKYQVEIVQKKLLPLVKEEIWPVARERAVPLANKIGKQVWERVSVGTFAGKFLIDRLPFTDGDALEAAIEELETMSPDQLRRHRRDKFLAIGRAGVS